MLITVTVLCNFPARGIGEITPIRPGETRVPFAAGGKGEGRRREDGGGGGGDRAELSQAREPWLRLPPPSPPPSLPGRSRAGGRVGKERAVQRRSNGRVSRC